MSLHISNINDNNFEWSDSGRQLWQFILREIAKSGSYNIYIREIELENMTNKFSPDAMLLKNTIRSLKWKTK